MGGDDWGFSVWAHNTYEVRHIGNGVYKIWNTETNSFVKGSVGRDGRFVPGGSEDLVSAGVNGRRSLEGFAGEFNGLRSVRTVSNYDKVVDWRNRSQSAPAIYDSKTGTLSIGREADSHAQAAARAGWDPKDPTIGGLSIVGGPDHVELWVQAMSVYGRVPVEDIPQIARAVEAFTGRPVVVRRIPRLDE